MRDLLHFAHGNGFPSPCYKQLLDQLHKRYNCCYIDMIGHNPRFPVTENWHFLVAEVIDSIKNQAKYPVIAVGHSLGGVLSLLAAVLEPSLFKVVITLDAPLLSRFKSNIVRFAKTLGMVDRVTPALRTYNRREHWQNKEELLSYLKTRPLFKTFTDQCLADYIRYGLTKTADGYVLRFGRHIEYMIYRTIPHSLYEYEKKLIVPAALIYGDASTVVDYNDIRYMKKYYNISSFKIAGTHMFPMESPRNTAEKIFTVLDLLL